MLLIEQNTSFKDETMEANVILDNENEKNFIIFRNLRAVIFPNII